jgi:flagellar hook assembly protein FlgD
MSTVITYELPYRTPVILRILNVAGQEVKRVSFSYQTAGVHTFTWDGTDNDGNVVATGVYLYQVQAGSNVVTRKMMLIK